MKNGGIAKLGQEFILKSKEYDDLMSRTYLNPVPEERLQLEVPLSRWNIMQFDSRSVSFNESQTATGNFYTIPGKKLSLRLSFIYVGNKSSNITIIPFTEAGEPCNPGFFSAAFGDTIEHEWIYNISKEQKALVRKVGLSVDVKCNNTNSTLFTARTSFRIIRLKNIAPSFSSNPAFISLALSVVFLTAIARKTKRKIS
jgi:hypothetical protein